MKHPQHDLLVALAKDSSLTIQIKVEGVSGSCYENALVHCLISLPNREYRIKPREFYVGNWYPVLHGGVKHVLLRRVRGFKISGRYVNDKEFSFIGKSLGELEFK